MKPPLPTFSLFDDPAPEPPARVEDAPVPPPPEPQDAQIARLLLWDFRAYDATDARQRAVVKAMLRQPFPRVKG